ncbi:MAG TPA: LysE family translocator [Allocoleopsis sp.]
MPKLSELYLFVAASLVMLLVPGPAVMYIAMQSIKQGRIAGAIAVLGLELGTVFHVVVAAFGVSALSPSILLFNILKGLGTAYLIYLGACNLLLSQKVRHQRSSQHESLLQIFWRGVIVEVLNPKTMLFFFAFLPQFVDHTRGDVALQMLILGCLFIGFATLIDLLYVILSGSLRCLLRERRWFVRGQHYVESSVYIGLSIATALSGAKS